MSKAKVKESRKYRTVTKFYQVQSGEEALAPCSDDELEERWVPPGWRRIPPED